MRLFAAVVPPSRALSELAAATSALAAQWPGVRWAGPEAWHVTLAFLGEVDESRVGAVGERMRRAAGRHQSIDLRIAGSGAFPSAARATVVWAGIDGDRPALAALAASVAAAARRAGYPPPDEGRRFRPHLTLGRCRAPADLRPLVVQLDGLAGTAWPASSVDLIRSHPPGLGRPPRYELLQSWPLQAPAERPPGYGTDAAERGPATPR
jgi:RNA 2',3'-cyclic 3'-phosphodiesterase